MKDDDVPLSERINRNMNLILTIANVLAFPAIIMLHRDIGRRFAGPQALLSVVLMFVWPAFDPASNPQPMLWLLGSVLMMCFVSRCAGLRRKGGGGEVFRHYNGYPRLMRWFACRDEVLVKRLHEPVLIVLIGILTVAWNASLGHFLMAVAAGLAVSINAGEFAANERVEALRDQYLQQQFLAERYRRFGGK